MQRRVAEFATSVSISSVQLGRNQSRRTSFMRRRWNLNRSDKRSLGSECRIVASALPLMATDSAGQIGTSPTNRERIVIEKSTRQMQSTEARSRRRRRPTRLRRTGTLSRSFLERNARAGIRCCCDPIRHRQRDQRHLIGVAMVSAVWGFRKGNESWRTDRSPHQHW